MNNDLQRKFETLPEELKEAITSVDFAKSLQEIGKTSGLHLDQLDQLFEEVGFVLLGMTHPNEFGKKISSLFNLPEVARNSLVKEVDEKIFKPIRVSLMSIHNKPAPSPVQTFTPKAAEIIPPAPAMPHEADYNSMSRDAILSAIEDPIKSVEKKLSADYSPKRNVETSDPKEYVEQRNEMIQKMKINPLAGSLTPPKKSLAEEAVLVAQKKVEIKTPPTPTPLSVPLHHEGISVPLPSPVIIQKLPPSIEIPKPAGVPTSSIEKLNSVVRIPRQSVNVTSQPTGATSSSNKTSDPYRETF